MRSKIFLVRHGVTDWNSQFRYQGISDIPLNAEGLEQAKRVALRFGGSVIEHAFSSPLCRAVKTAETIAASCGSCPPIEQRSELTEISFGRWEGLTVDEIKKDDAETYERWRERPFSCAPEGGEPFDSVMARARKFASEVASCGGDTLVVAHGGILRAVAAALLGAPDPDILWRVRMENCSITVFDVWSGFPPALFALNDILHLAIDGEAASRLPLPGEYRSSHPSLESA